MSKINEIYISKINTPSDINEHMTTLYEFSLKCKTIAEFGVSNVVSSYAFANSRPEKLICVDIVKNNYEVDNFLSLCEDENINAEFYEHDSRTFKMENVDLIFIDTKHNYLQLKEELNNLGNKSNKYLIFHDTITFGQKDEFPEFPPQSHTGLMPAIKEFLSENSNWKEVCTYSNNNGLTILERVF